MKSLFPFRWIEFDGTDYQDLQSAKHFQIK